MGGQQVLAPDGGRWVVRRRWAPRLGTDSLWSRMRARYKKTVRRTGDLADATDGGQLVPDVADELVVLLVVIVVVASLVFVAVPLLLIVIDLVVVLLLTVLGLVGRVAFRRPWTVEAVADEGTRQTWKVVGWRASGAHCDTVVQHLQAGIAPTPDGPVG